MREPNPSSEWNASQKLHLLTSFQYADKLLAEIEAVLSSASAKSAFPKFKPDITPAQAKVVQDYLAQFRAQMLRVLASQGIAAPLASLGSIHSIRVTLTFIRIAFEECTPDRMRGYGELPASSARELHGIVGEMTAAVEKLQQYLAQGLGQDFQARLERLSSTGDEINLLRDLERIINNHGLVEFRPVVSMILDRLEKRTFEIALFGRVSSGKSSLLNYIAGEDVLPVGVNPITAVPTRVAFGKDPGLSIWFAHRPPERAEVSRLAEFVTEQLNPGNSKHVTRITVELPSQRLRDGVVLVDTPGLGSLATAGAAETLAYLPRCDLGVVLVDAGAALTQDDLGTIRALYESGVPASVLLSKADVLTPPDQARASEYIADHIRRELELSLSVHPVSVKPESSFLLDRWLQQEIVSLLDRHQQLAEESIRRKIGALRESVVAAVTIRLDRSRGEARPDASILQNAEDALRSAAGCFEVAREECLKATDEVRQFGGAALKHAASRILERWRESQDQAGDWGGILADALTKLPADKAALTFAALDALAKDLTQALRSAAAALDLPDPPGDDELRSLLKEMPRIDIGPLGSDFQPNLLRIPWRWMAKRQIENSLRNQYGPGVAEAFSSYGKMLEAWTRRMLADLQRHFEARADTYRAHLRGLAASGSAPTAKGAEKEALERDLDRLMSVALPANRSEGGQ
jgi:GTP-binding protein EngB required for normal cell division